MQRTALFHFTDRDSSRLPGPPTHRQRWLVFRGQRAAAVCRCVNGKGGGTIVTRSWTGVISCLRRVRPARTKKHNFVLCLGFSHRRAVCCCKRSCRPHLNSVFSVGYYSSVILFLSSACKVRFVQCHIAEGHTVRGCPLLLSILQHHPKSTFFRSDRFCRSVILFVSPSCKVRFVQRCCWRA